MENQHEAGSDCSSSDLFSDLFRVDAEIRKMRHALLIANRLKDREPPEGSRKLES